MSSLRSLRSRVVLSNKSNEVYKSSKNCPKEVIKVGGVLNSCTEGKPIRKKEHISVWNRNLSPNKPKNRKKNGTKIDIYDISLDEEMSCEVALVKSKAKKCLKTNTKKNKKKCLPRLVEHPKKSDREILFAKSNVNKQAAVKTNQKSSKLTGCVDNPAEKEIQNSFPDKVIPVVPEENMDVEVSDVIPESIDDHTFLLNLVDELEKSFLVPKMTSTPNEMKVNPQKSNAVKPVIPKIPYNPSLKKVDFTQNHKTVLTQKNLPDNIDKDITLFESPTKVKKKQKETKINFIQVNLFGECSKTPSSPLKLDVSVIKPKKSYTPDNIKNNLARTKRTPVENKRKSKENVFIEKMSQHFEEIGRTELCVE